ncbi:uncharacterized protein [Dermacentor albipictus]|uniref:uncharacterized protein n=1 Tax=Dermacentor albipictus TaxID=60249 RepID=UPI0031FD4C1B
MGPCPAVREAPIKSIIAFDVVEAGPPVNDFGQDDLAEDAAGDHQEAPVNPPAVPPNPPDVPVNPPGALPNPPDVPANLPEAPPINKSATVLQYQQTKCQAVIYGAVCCTICGLFSLTFLGTPGPRATAPTPTILLQQPWNPWPVRVDDLLVPRIMVWIGRSSEPAADPRVVKPATVMAGPRASISNQKRIACRLIDHRDDDLLEHECTVTYDQRLVMESDAIVFPADSVNINFLPTQRAIPQLWVLWARKAPALDIGALAEGHFGKRESSSSNSDESLALFNWTMGSREDAHVNVKYKSFRPRSPAAHHSPLPPGRLNASERSAMLKTRGDAAWIAADCEQEMFEEERQKWMVSVNDCSVHNCVFTYVARSLEMHVMPSCGASYCESLADCVAYVARHFNFIIVTETPACFQSADELIYEAFKHDLVPIMIKPLPSYLHMLRRGRAPVSQELRRQLPPHSVVSGAEMRPGHLSDYLRYLLNHPAAYEEYFAWKRNFTVTTLDDDLCPMCVALHDLHKGKVPTGRDVREWWRLRAKCGDGSL